MINEFKKQQEQSSEWECTRCHYPLVSKQAQSFSKKVFGRVLCRSCQEVTRGERTLKRMSDVVHEGHETINLDNGMTGCITCEAVKQDGR